MPNIDVQEEQVKLLRKSLIVQLGILGVPQRKIRALVGCDVALDSEVLQLLDPKKIREKQGG